MDPFTIKEIKSVNEIVEAFPVMKQLRTHLDENSYLELVLDAQESDRYKMFALVDAGEIVAVIGFKTMITLYYGRFVWVCDLVTDINKRSKGYGEQLLTYVHQWAKENNYETISLSSGLQRKDTHRFYEERMNYDKVSYVFKKSLN
ncbi:MULTISPECIES: GNAT family N-acetyltransferase [unclassified Bacillus (in: firmicutes)]|uniref:GNAT family N-acetyltransferase n=1 Tax=unclassified Bacillus (in: firmicutes) TaxID=185979 RepID=UPI00080AEA22|nr:MULTISPECIES: GNAT family N-acetyltransferase [unclassified Bacillus (in: firmicutes)]OCA90083.1 acetyltransferase [Bacillus sp. FJAT-27986]